RARALEIPHRGSGRAYGLGLRLSSWFRAWRRQGPGRPWSDVRAGTDGRGGALSHGIRMGAFSGRHSLAALKTRPDHAARRSRGAGGVHGDRAPNLGCSRFALTVLKT